MPSPIELALSSLLPTLSPLPNELTQLSTSLLAQSRTKASSLKPEEEIGRTYACCHIACERLGKKLALEIGKPMPPVQPRVYAKLKTYLGTCLRTPVTPRARRVEDKLGCEGVGKGTPTSVRARDLSGSVGGGGTPMRAGGGTPASAAGRGLRSAEVTSGKSAGGTPGTAGRKRKAGEIDAEDARPEIAESSTTRHEQLQDEDVDMADPENDEEDDEPLTPAKRPSKTPLRRKEKHARRNGDGLEDLGAAGLLPGLGTMFQPAVDWLSEERRAEYAMWKKGMMREIAKFERQVA